MTGFAKRLCVWPVLLLAAAGTAMAGPEARQPQPSRLPTTEATQDARLRKANQEFEAAALQVMLAPMFSRKDSKLFGEGVAGKYWQSMLSEQIARQIATSGRLHLMPVAGGRRLPQTRRNPIGAMAVPACKGQGCPEKGGWTTRVQRVSQEAP